MAVGTYCMYMYRNVPIHALHVHVPQRADTCTAQCADNDVSLHGIVSSFNLHDIVP